MSQVADHERRIGALEDFQRKVQSLIDGDDQITELPISEDKETERAADPAIEKVEEILPPMLPIPEPEAGTTEQHDPGQAGDQDQSSGEGKE